MAVNKVIFNGNILVDLTGTTVAEGTLMKGATALDASGNMITGTATVTATDDGVGNVTLHLPAATTVSDDGAGDVTIS